MQFWLLLIGIAFILVGRDLFAEGMFVDGVTYASIARNMAEGQGSFWNPCYTQTLYPVFHQHPPLALGMEALFFKAFGDRFWVEKVYSMLTFLLSGLLIAAIWKRTTNRPQWAWMPLLFWVAMPLVTWSAKNNLLENTMAIFVLLSVWLMILSYQKNSKLWLLMAGASLYLAFLTKGFTGLFPLAFPLFYCIFDERRHWIQGPVDILLLFFTMAVLSGLTFLFHPEWWQYLKDYIHIQVIEGGLHEVTVSSRFYIVLSLLQQLVIPAVIVVILFVIRKIAKIRQEKIFEFRPDRKWFVVFLLLGLSGVLPIMVSVKQRDFYMQTALPFFALACSYLCLSLMGHLHEKMNLKRPLHIVFTLSSLLVLLVGVLLPPRGVNTYSRDEALLKDTKAILTELAEEKTLGIAQEDFSQWEWHAYFMRYGKVSLDDRNHHSYVLVKDDHHLKLLTSNF